MIADCLNVGFPDFSSDDRSSLHSVYGRGKKGYIDGSFAYPRWGVSEGLDTDCCGINYRWRLVRLCTCRGCPIIAPSNIESISWDGSMSCYQKYQCTIFVPCFAILVISCLQRFRGVSPFFTPLPNWASFHIEHTWSSAHPHGRFASGSAIS
jgi:hypothetical protein